MEKVFLPNKNNLSSQEKFFPWYPERLSAKLDPGIKRLKELEKGQGKMELLEEERESILAFEKNLASDLEAVFKISPRQETFYPAFFLTTEGKKALEGLFGERVDFQSEDQAKAYLYAKRKKLGNLESKELRELAGNSRKHTEEILFRKLQKTITPEGAIDVKDIPIDDRFSIIVSASKALEKIEGLRNLKRRLKSLDDLFQKDFLQGSENIKKAKLAILDIYKKRINEIIAFNFDLGVSIKKMENAIGTEKLSTEEKEITEIFSGLNLTEKNASRLDQLFFGTSSPNDEEGSKQISGELKRYADAIEQQYIKNELEKKSILTERGLDPEKIFSNKNITAEECRELAEELLEHYGLKSQYPADNFDYYRKEAAPDGKWQVVVSDQFQSMEVSSLQKVIKIKADSYSPYALIAIVLGHEAEGHFFQSLNKENIPLEIFRRNIKGDRSELFFEGGAMMIQDIVSKEAFGIRSLPHPHYIRAMQKKIEGGDYLECLKAFYESALKVTRQKKEQGLIDEIQFKKELDNNLALAIGRVKRLFRNGGSLLSKEPYLTKSKDTAYLEQLILVDKLKQQKMEKYALVEGINLENLILLAENGLIDLSHFKFPDYYSLEVWEKKIKERCTIDEQK